MNKILVTGVNGFVGHHVADQLHGRGFIVIGVGNQPSLQDDLTHVVDDYIGCDLTSADDVSGINLSGISAIINLAGFAKVGESIGQGELYNRVNVGVHSVLYEECIRQEVLPRIIAVSTGAVYDPAQPLPLTEESTLVSKNNANEYIISKILAEQTVSAFGERGLRCIVARPFNHSGPGQLPGFLVPDLSEQLETAVRDGKPLMVGNLDTKRDYTDVRDVARAYIELATCKESNLKHNVYNICSGKSTSGKEILQYLARAYDTSKIKTETDLSRIRPNEIMDIYGSRDRLTEDTGWQPNITVQQMIKDFVAWQKKSK